MEPNPKHHLVTILPNSIGSAMLSRGVRVSHLLIPFGIATSYDMLHALIHASLTSAGNRFGCGDTCI